MIYLGIDLGTTNSTAAYFDGNSVTIIRSSDGSALTPSVVRIDGKGKITVGERARRLRDSDADNVRGEFKRLMGTEHVLAFPASKLSFRPEELAAEVLKSIREDARQQLGFAPERVVITVPALFEIPQTRATSEAARLAGFERVEFLQEPIASALAAGWTAETDATDPWLVYDLGGGTFDVSLLETQDGLLRVVGHDGDNFLGGKDFDSVVVDWAITQLHQESDIKILRENPTHRPALARLKNVAEEARIELSRAKETSLYIPALRLDTETLAVDLTLTSAVYETLAAPLIARSIAVCRRLLARHGLGGAPLSRVVLVGGPTISPFLRMQITEALGVTTGPLTDPMTLVAQGAALYAASLALDARPASKQVTTNTAPRIWLQHPTVSSDLSPWIVGRRVEAELKQQNSNSYIEKILFRRIGDTWESTPETLDADGTFAIPVQLKARQSNTFEIFGIMKDGTTRALCPSTLTIMHGVTIGDPPLARSIGIALANNNVQTFLERGSPLPMRRSYTLKTIETIVAGAPGYALNVPIVQGEFPLAHLCRLVGTLQINGEQVNATLPAGSDIEVTLDLDRGGKLAASAYIVAFKQVFDEVAHLVAPKVPANELREQYNLLQNRANEARRTAFRSGISKAAAILTEAESLFSELAHDLPAAEGGDEDATERARRTLIDIDAILAEIEAERAWPDMIDDARTNSGWAVGWVAEHGNDVERQTLDTAIANLEKAILARAPTEITRQTRLILQLGHSAYLRSPGAWDNELDFWESRIAESTNPQEALRIVKEGHAAQKRRDKIGVERCVRNLWRLLPPDQEDRMHAHGSGVR